MKKYQSASKMSTMNLLVLVTALCLVVLSVLSLVSANAAKTFTEKQDASASQYYTQESIGQSFLFLLGEGWHNACASGDVGDVDISMTSGYMEAALSKADDGESMVSDVNVIGTEELYSDMNIPFEVRGNMSAYSDYLDEPGRDYKASIASALEDCVGGVSFSLVNNDGRTLNALIGLRTNGKLTVFDWESSREWEAKDEQLWVPDGSDDALADPTQTGDGDV